jgi:diadenosine tetraphosphatase ApaH/serine/threonine PP2A family protein phosphatase
MANEGTTSTRTARLAAVTEPEGGYMDRNHIHTTWDATYHPFEETLATGDCDFLSRLISEALADGDGTLLTKWGATSPSSRSPR